MEPSRRIIADSNQSITVTDSDGRKIDFRRPNALDTLRLLKAAGPVLSQNEAWLSMASLAFTITSIDGLPTPQPASESQIENLIAKLGHAGLMAVGNALDQEPDGQDVSLGNSHGTQF